MTATISSAPRLDRQQRHEAFWQSRKKKFFLIIGLLSVLLQVLFLGNMAYLYGSLWKSTSRYSAFKVLYVDYDGGVLGQSVHEAYKQMQGPAFPTFVPQNKDLYSSMEDVVDAVKNTSVEWRHGGIAAREYNASDAVMYVWNEVRYSPFSDEIFMASFEKLIAATRLAYNALNGQNALQILSQEDPASLQVLLNPVMASTVNIMPTTQQTKLFYNTVSMVMPILQQFFFLLIMNGISQKLQIYSKLPLQISGIVRGGLSVLFDLIASLCMSGYIWAFRESWDVSGSQFAFTWMVLWLLMHIHILIIDAATAFLPLPALPFFLLTWIIVNITSSISPFEANPSFYRWGYALPTNEAYTVLTHIWSNGSVPQLYRALPIMFSWWIVGIGVATYGHFYRCHKAWQLDADREESARRGLDQNQNGKSEGSDVSRASRDPVEALVEAADVYRTVYGPSVPLPEGLWRAFTISESVVNPGLAEPAEHSSRMAGS